MRGRKSLSKNNVVIHYHFAIICVAIGSMNPFVSRLDKTIVKIIGAHD